jgi:hypothetical protein
MSNKSCQEQSRVIGGRQRTLIEINLPSAACTKRYKFWETQRQPRYRTGQEERPRIEAESNVRITEAYRLASAREMRLVACFVDYRELASVTTLKEDGGAYPVREILFYVA